MYLFATDTTGTCYETDLLDLVNETETTVEPTNAHEEQAAAPAKPVTPNLTYVVTMNTGEVSTRSSKTVVYTHALQVTDKQRGTTFVFSWHKSHANAVKATGGNINDYYRDVKVLPVASYPFSSTEAKAARAAEKARRAAK